jgi:hypothetical protein
VRLRSAIELHEFGHVIAFGLVTALLLVALPAGLVGVLSGTPGENLLSPYIFTSQVIDTLTWLSADGHIRLLQE